MTPHGEEMRVTPLASFPPPEKWDDWVEYDAKAWPRRVERHYALVPTTCFNCEAACGLVAYVDLETDQEVGRVSIPIPEGTPVPPLDTYTHGMLLTPNQRELWIGAYGTDKVYAFLMPESAPLAEIELPGGPHWLTLNPDGEPLYVTLERSGQVAAIHRGIREVIQVADVGTAPTRILAFRTPVE